MRADEPVAVDTDPSLIALQANQQEAALVPAFVAVPGQLRSIGGQDGPDIAVNTAAAVNGVAVSFAAAADTLTFGLTGIGTMAQRNAAAANADAASPDATDLATALTLLNELKAQFNALQAKLRTAGHLTP
jgi:hypothetical protein